jgi:hypothetical protein
MLILPEILVFFKKTPALVKNCKVFDIDVFHGFWFSENGTNQYASFRTDLKYTAPKHAYKLVTLPCTVTSYCDSADRTRDHIMCQKLITQ